ncbi:MAG: FMN-binding glutamate synthase family protein [Planctomycetota bacterium]|nr:FMN-binding glutamate synthase family protein [Planctomycetota bacterium]
MSVRQTILRTLGGALLVSLVLCLWSLAWAYLAAGVFALCVVAFHDVTQTRRAILRNFPVIGHGRYLMEAIRPEVNQYFVESNTDGKPFSRELRSVVYQRAKGERDTVPFGTQSDVYAVGYEWLNHSLNARHPDSEPGRVLVGADTCAKPYSLALLNASAMSFGSLSSRAILALNLGAKAAGFAQNTGEGGVSPYHLEGGGDLIWQIGTGYFGCRSPEGEFEEESFVQTAGLAGVKMIEVKLSQGAKPGHGGILPGAKVTPEIARIRSVPVGQDVLSPPSHSAFDDPRSLLQFLERLRRLSGGKPVGIKLCVGRPQEFMALCKAMVAEGAWPDFISVDGGEGGTGAAPLEFSNAVGSPLVEALVLVHNALVGFGLRDRVRVFASGKIATGFHMAQKMALGADACFSARAMMMAMGCIQARECNANTCPVGVATQDPGLVSGLDVAGKARRVEQFQRGTVQSLLELAGAAGLGGPEELLPDHIQKRIAPDEVRSYMDLYPFLERGALLSEPIPPAYEEAWKAADPATF